MLTLSVLLQSAATGAAAPQPQIDTGSNGGPNDYHTCTGLTANGYFVTGSDGTTIGFGGDNTNGAVPFPSAIHLDGPVVAVTTGLGSGNVVATAADVVHGFDPKTGVLTDYPGMSGTHFNAPIVGMSVGTDAVSGVDANQNGGYWLVGQDGGVFSFGDTQFCGWAAGRLGSPVVGITGTYAEPFE
jgi:hypothetical protein